MRQLFYLGPRTFEWRESEPPRPGPSEAVVRPTAVALCDLDVALIKGNVPISGPFAFGHEFVGEVVEVGEAVSRFSVGDRVLVSFQICCGECLRCQKGLTGSCERVREGAMYGLGPIAGEEWGGAFADLVRVPYADFMMLALPEGIDQTWVASGSDNLPDAWRCVAPQLEEYPGAEVLIVAGGAPSIGLYAVQIAGALGASRVDYVDMDEERRALAEKLGATPIQGPPAEKMGRYPITVDASGRPEGLAAALRSTDSGGTSTSVGIYFVDPTIPFLNMYTRGITFRTGRPQARATMPRVLELVAERKVDPGEIQTVVDWDDLPGVLGDPPVKLVAAC